jgi:hypothetical protein
MSRHVSSCVLGRVPSGPTRSSGLDGRRRLLLRLALNLSPHWILMHRGIAPVLPHRLYGLLEVLGVHLAAGVRFLNIVKFLLEGRAHLDHLVDFTVDAPFL